MLIEEEDEEEERSGSMDVGEPMSRVSLQSANEQFR